MTTCDDELQKFETNRRLDAMQINMEGCKLIGYKSYSAKSSKGFVKNQTMGMKLIKRFISINLKQLQN